MKVRLLVEVSLRNCPTKGAQRSLLAEFKKDVSGYGIHDGRRGSVGITKITTDTGSVRKRGGVAPAPKKHRGYANL